MSNNEFETPDDGLRSLKEALKHAKSLELPEVDEEANQKIEDLFEDKIDETDGRKL